ncbi:NAD(P)-binding protein [Polyplosphaeria fusca]|uniref:NAD(P)-binding protein n=1 Tax=Polyplosphaeria fusca TaxID=682080 RepID=A0A9P4UZV3_9PLEO|nr:NAD(P)-binding protein [Polyplosphaeria fusca]
MPSEYQLHGQTQYDWQDTAALANLRLNKNVPKPTNIPAGHALVRIRAAALNARDMMVVAQNPIYPGPHMQDLVPCADGAGEVETPGANSAWKKGDRVLINSNSMMDWDYSGSEPLIGYKEAAGKGASEIQGTLREYAVLPDSHLIRAPSHLSYEELAAMPAAGATAMHALFFGPRAIKPGNIVLAQGTGGVSCFVIQLAAAAGATVIATSSSDEKLQQAKALGATHLINYKTTPAWDDEVLRVTGGRGVDVVVEVAGSSTIAQSLRASRRGGLVAVVGFLSESKEQDLVIPIIMGGYTVYGVFMYTKVHTEAMTKMFEEKRLKPVIAKVFEWEDAGKAFEMLSRQSAVGKIVIKVAE